VDNYKHTGKESKFIFGLFIRPLSYLAALMASFVIPFLLWAAWAQRSTLIGSLVQTVLCLSLAWAIVVMLRAQHSLRKLELSSSDLMPYRSR
jgi:RsiW-degrading membrane proteinase PrsW (M82 family)